MTMNTPERDASASKQSKGPDAVPGAPREPRQTSGNASVRSDSLANPQFAPALVSLYELGVRLRQAQVLIEEKKDVSNARAASVPQALLLLGMAFERLFAATDKVASWKARTESSMETARNVWDGRLAWTDNLAEPAQVIATHVQELALIARHCAESLAGEFAQAKDWLRLGTQIVDAVGPDSLPDDKLAVNQHLAKIGVDRKQFLPEPDGELFSVAFPDLDMDFGQWVEIEVGLSMLRTAQAETSSVVHAEEPITDEWTHAVSEPMPEAFKPNGPLEGTQKELSAAMHPAAKSDARYLKQEARKGHIWVQKVSVQFYRVFFENQGLWEKAREKLAKFKNDTKATRNQPKNDQ
jgi:hypothetical protein